MLLSPDLGLICYYLWMDNDALERLANRVDRKEGSEPLQRRPLYSTGTNAPRGWKHEEKKRWALPAIFSRFSALELLFVGSIIFFIGAAAIASLLIFSGNNTVSTKNVNVAVSGPNTVRAGDEVTLQVVITNQNAVPMTLTDMLIEFPPGTRSPIDVSVDLPRIRESLGTIEPGASVNRTVKAVMFGQAGVAVDVQVSAEYRVPSSNAVFQSSTIYHATISQSPASIAVETLKEVVSGQPTEITVRVASNASENLTGMLLTAAYPPGFSFISATPKPVSGTSVWDLGDIEASGVRTVTIQGTFTGEDGEDRVIHFTSGTKKKTDASTIAAPLAAADTTIKVAKPFVSVQIVLNGNSTGSLTAARGEIIRGEVRWANNLPVTVQDVEIDLKLNGVVLDKTTVRSGQAFFRSTDNTLLFSKSTDQRFATVEPGTTETGIFQFAALPPGQGSFQSPQIVLTATVRANRSAEGGVIDVVTSSAQASVQLSTDLALSSTLQRVTGPQPPKVDQETVYNISWLVANSANAIADTVVTAVLPSYVSWKGETSSPDVTYNPNGRTVTWSIGDVAASANKSATFKVGVVPSLSQINTQPVIVGNQRISAFDRFIRANVERAGAETTTGTGTSLQQGTVVP